MALALLAVGCGDGDVEEAAESGGARVVAEALRARLIAEDLGEDARLRDVGVLTEAIGDLPGDPRVIGVEDRDGDGRDDDGRVEVRVGEEAACLSVSADGEDVDVRDGRC